MFRSFQRLTKNFTNVPCDGNQSEFGQNVKRELNNLRDIFNELADEQDPYELYLTDSLGSYLDPFILYNPKLVYPNNRVQNNNIKLEEILTKLNYQNYNIKKLEFYNLNDFEPVIVGATSTQEFECDNIRSYCRCYDKEFKNPSYQQIVDQGYISNSKKFA